jgi:hypothetical protein
MGFRLVRYRILWRLFWRQTAWLKPGRVPPEAEAAFFKSRTNAPPNDEEMLYAAVAAPQDERLRRVVAYAKNYHFPELPEEQIAEVLSREDNRFLNIALRMTVNRNTFSTGYSTPLCWDTSTLQPGRTQRHWLTCPSSDKESQNRLMWERGSGASFG